jgi:mRNA interferase MazF
VTLCLLTSELRDAPLFRVPVERTEENGLQIRSQVMVDKVLTVSKEKIKDRIGIMDPGTLIEIDRALALWLGIGQG